MKLTLNIILLFRLIFGHYFKINRSTLLRRLARCYCILVCIYNTVFLGYIIRVFFSSNTFISGTFVSSALYSDATTNMLVSFITREENVIQFSDNYFESGLESYVPWDSYVAYSLPLILLIGKCVVFYIFGGNAYGSLILQLYTIPFLTTCTAHLTSVYVTEAYRRCVYCLKKSLKNNLNGSTSDDDKNNHVKHFVRLYVKLSKMFSATFKYVRFRIALGLIFSWEKIINEIIYFMDLETGTVIRRLPWHFDTVTYIMITSIPFIMMEFTANDLDEIKTVLVDELLICKNEKYRVSLHDTLGYIDVCMNRYTMWHKFPVNISTLLRCLNMCITFAIVILQFMY